VHFYSNFWSFKRSNRVTVARIQASRRRARASPRTPHLGPPATLSFWVHARLPRPRAPRSRAPSRPGGSCPRRDVPAMSVPSLALVCAARAQATYKSHRPSRRAFVLPPPRLDRNRPPCHPSPSRLPAPLEAAVANPGLGRPHCPTEAPSTSSGTC
jgi:hypothetical protein